MFTKKKLKISLPSPCDEDWNQMSSTGKGKFCNSCRKEVIDFTVMSDLEIMNFISKHKYSFCASFSPNQLNRNIVDESKPNYSIVRKILAGIVAVLSFKYSHSEIKMKEQYKMTVSPYDLKQLDSADENSIKEYKISGIVTISDSSKLKGEPILIRIANTPIEMNPDSNGYYSITILEQDLKPYTIITFYHTNFKHETRTIHISNFPLELNIKLEPPPSGRIGGMPVMNYGN